MSWHQHHRGYYGSDLHDRIKQLHYRSAYSQMQDMTDSYLDFIQEFQNFADRIFSEFGIQGNILSNQIFGNDPSWHTYGTIPFGEAEEDLEEEMRWVLRNINAHSGPLPRSSKLDLCLRAIDTEGNMDPDIYVFYSISRPTSHSIAPKSQ